MLEPDLFPSLTIENRDRFLKEFERQDKLIKAGVEIVGDPQDVYGLVWEWGNRRQKKPGPKTVIGTNPNKKMVWMSSQAPFGWIRINEPFMLRIVEDVMATADFVSPDRAAIKRELERLAKKISKGCAEVLKMSAPVDTGALRKAIKPVDPGDAILDQEADELDALELGED